MPVAPVLSKEELRARLGRYDFERPLPLEEVLPEVLTLLAHGNLHTIHRRYFGLFNPSVGTAGVAGDLLAALANPQLGAWWHAPAANEIESRALEFLCRCVGFDWATSHTTFTTGGSESNLTAVLAALVRRFPRYGADGLASLPRRPAIYASDHAHDSFVKIAHVVGLGRSALRRVRSDRQGRIELGDLARRVEEDRHEGYEPFLVVGTAGTTALGAIDPLHELATYSEAQDLWLHVDAAWGGLGLLSRRLKTEFAGIERANSVAWDAHKTMAIPMGAGMIFLRGVEGARAAEAAFEVRTAYVPETADGTIDLYRRSLQWSRRFIGLKVFLTIAENGAPGLARVVDHQMDMAALLRRLLIASGWTIVNETPLPLVCFSHPSLQPSCQRVPALVDRVISRGAVWLSEVRLGSEHQLRACITNHRTGPEDVRALVDALDLAIHDGEARGSPSAAGDAA
jgi:glutamate/tyrosine decarboxylase-like PLP-dependent enzyme